MPFLRKWTAAQATAAVAFILATIALLVAEWYVSANLPYLFPIGGNDEPLHLSMANYIATHLKWPRWDSPELLRYFGTSYASDSSFNYWIEGLLIRWTDQTRWSPRLLFAVYLAVLAPIAWRSPVVGLFGLAAVTPQVLFIFSYVNSDAWTTVVALLLGIAAARFYVQPTGTSSVVFLFVTGAACLTCRPHMWVIGCLTFSVVLLSRVRMVLDENPRSLLAAVLPALVVGGWWPVTSFIANDGDFIGRTTAEMARVKFAVLDPPLAGLDESEISVVDFSSTAGTSFYGRWGWGTIALYPVQYQLAALIGLPLLIFALTRSKAYWGLFVPLFLVNASLMYFAGLRFGPAIWQGRYLYPTFFVVLGWFLEDASRREVIQVPRRWSWGLVGGLCCLICLNVSSSWTLWSLTQTAEENAARMSRFERSVRLINSGRPAEAEKLLVELLEEDGDDTPALNVLGYLQMQDARLTQAQETFEQLLSLDPANSDAALRLAQIYMRTGHPDAALGVFHFLLFEHQESIASNEIGAVWARTGDWGAVIEFCKAVLERNRRDLRARRVLSVLERWQRRVAERKEQEW